MQLNIIKQYSSRCWTLKRFSLDSFRWKLWLISLTSLRALETWNVACSVNGRISGYFTPKSQMLLSYLNYSLFSCKLVCGLNVQPYMYPGFSILRETNHPSHWSLSCFFCVIQLIFKRGRESNAYTTLGSPAKRKVLPSVKQLHMSLTYMMNKKGPMIEPWRTPPVRFWGSERWCSVLATWVRSLRKDEIQSCLLPTMLRVFSSNRGQVLCFIERFSEVKLESGN